MENNDFEGYTGLFFNNNIFSYDIMLVIVILLLAVFAFEFRKNIQLFGKMISNMNAREQRQSIFETTENDSFLFSSFMIFQTLLLLSILLFLLAVEYEYIINPDFASTLLTIGFFFLLFFAFYLFKQVLYAIFSTVFIEKSSSKIMFTNYQALFCTWGISLYIPILCILLIDTHPLVSIIFLSISYLAFLIILSFRFFYIFYNKYTGFLFLSLYLCAQEMVPLVFLYKGMVYMYNVMK